MVDVVVRLHGPTDQAPKLRHLRVLAHVQLDDDPRTPIQQNVGEEFRQHDGVLTILMFYRRRAWPKHRYNIIEEDYGGGGHRTRLKDQTINCCVSRVPPAPVYKGARGRCGQPGGERGGGEEGKGGRRPPLLVLFGLGGRCGRPGGARQVESYSHRE